MRAFVEKEIMPYAHDWDEAKAMPRDIWRKCAEAGWLAGVIGPPWYEFIPNIPTVRYG
jgi:alkylation response protein AidB-like acyl-CoA dehydrogenase